MYIRFGEGTCLGKDIFGEADPVDFLKLFSVSISS